MAEVLISVLLIVQFIALLYIIFGKESKFKQNFIDGLAFKFLWKKK